MKDNNNIKLLVISLMHGCSNYAFAKKCGISEGVVRKILRGEGAKDLILEKIAEACGKRLEWFYKHEQSDSVAVIDEGVGERLTPSVKEELLKMTGEVLESETVYRPALVSNIRAFHHGIKGDEEVGDLRKEMAAMMKEIKEMRADDKAYRKNVETRLGIFESEKKRAGNAD